MKTIKLKESDLVKVVKNTLKENEEQETTSTPRPPQSGDVELTVGKDKNGKYYVIKDAYTDNPQLVYKQP